MSENPIQTTADGSKWHWISHIDWLSRLVWPNSDHNILWSEFCLGTFAQFYFYFIVFSENVWSRWVSERSVHCVARIAETTPPSGGAMPKSPRALLTSFHLCLLISMSISWSSGEASLASLVLDISPRHSLRRPLRCAKLISVGVVPAVAMQDTSLHSWGMIASASPTCWVKFVLRIQQPSFEKEWRT